jgi:hypothetical protein
VDMVRKCFNEVPKGAQKPSLLLLQDCTTRTLQAISAEGRLDSKFQIFFNVRYRGSKLSSTIKGLSQNLAKRRLSKQKDSDS